MADFEKQGTKGPYIRWIDWGPYEGWHPYSYDSLREAVEVLDDHPFVVNKAVQYEINELDADAK